MIIQVVIVSISLLYIYIYIIYLYYTLCFSLLKITCLYVSGKFLCSWYIIHFWIRVCMCVCGAGGGGGGGRGRITNCVQRVILHIMFHSKYTKKCDVACSSKLLIFTISLLPQNMTFNSFCLHKMITEIFITNNPTHSSKNTFTSIILTRPQSEPPVACWIGLSRVRHGFRQSNDVLFDVVASDRGTFYFWMSCCKDTLWIYMLPTYVTITTV